MLQSIIDLFEKQASGVFDDVEYYSDPRETTEEGEFIVHYKGMIFSVQFYTWQTICVDASLTGIMYKGKNIEPLPTEWNYTENTNSYTGEELVAATIYEITNCDAKKLVRKVATVVDSIKEDLSNEEFELLKTLLYE